MKNLDKREKPPKIVNDIITQKKNISEQLKLLRRNRNLSEVQEYIDRLTKNKDTSAYVLYLIDKYYYNNKNAKKAEKNNLEKFGKVILRPDEY